VDSVLAVIPACQNASAAPGKVAMPPMSPAQFKKLWNAQVAQHPELQSATVK
jgi:hypothetical protein